MNNRTHKPATGQEIQEIIGHGSGELVTEIMRVGATMGEIVQACEWLDDDDYMGKREIPMDARARLIYEILRKDRERLETYA